MLDKNNRLSAGAKFVFAVMIVLTVVVGILVYQVDQRNEAITDLKSNVSKVGAQVDEIKKVADTVNTPDPDREAQTQQLYAAILETREIICQFEDPPVHEACIRIEKEKADAGAK